MFSHVRIPALPPGSAVGLGYNPISPTANPASSSSARYPAGDGKKLAATASASTPNSPITARSAVRIAAIFPWPPISATNRPPGFNALQIAARLAACSPAGIQCSAAFENTASNRPANAISRTGRWCTSNPRARAAATISAEASTPVIRAPVPASRSVNAPSPQPTSRISSPGLGASRSTTGVARSATKRPLKPYADVSHRWPRCSPSATPRSVPVGDTP